MSLVRPVLNAWLKWTEKPKLARSTEVEAVRRDFERKAWLFFHRPRGTTIEVLECAGRPALRVSAGGSGGPLILYFHGGAYFFGSPRTHSAMVARICKDAGADAIVPDYRKAPEHPFPAALEDAEAAYAEIRADHPDRPIILGGDSAGGGLAFALLARLIASGSNLPAGIFGFSPLTDMTYSGGSVRENQAHDVMLPVSQIPTIVEMYLGNRDPRDPGASPLFGDFKGAPPVFLTVGDTEILRDDAVRLKEVLEDQGVAVTFGLARDLPHVWPIFHNTLPEARATIRVLSDWIRQVSQR